VTRSGWASTPSAMGSRPSRSTRVGTQASRTALTADASAGATNIKVRGVNRFAVGDKLTVGTPANYETEAPETRIGNFRVRAPPKSAHDPVAWSAQNSRACRIILKYRGLTARVPACVPWGAQLPFRIAGVLQNALTTICFSPFTRTGHPWNQAVGGVNARSSCRSQGSGGILRFKQETSKRIRNPDIYRTVAETRAWACG
jgi:hypothetical protein